MIFIGNRPSLDALLGLARAPLANACYYSTGRGIPAAIAWVAGYSRYAKLYAGAARTRPVSMEPWLSAASRASGCRPLRTWNDDITAWAAAAEKILNDHLAGEEFDERMWGAARSYRWFLVGANTMRRTAFRPPDLAQASWDLLETLHSRGYLGFSAPRGVAERLYD